MKVEKIRELLLKDDIVTLIYEYDEFREKNGIHLSYDDYLQYINEQYNEKLTQFSKKFKQLDLFKDDN